jgi:DNA-binding PadR family transcriptional regulator
MRHVVKQPNVTNKALSEPVLLILTSLADEPRHGYALMKHIESLSEGRVRLSTGTLYGAIRRLLQAGWIEPFDQEDVSREKQAYRLTSAGRKELESQLDRMKELTRKLTLQLKTRRT